jgi:hypothetical protein
MKILITENKFEKTLQNQIDKILKKLKIDAVNMPEEFDDQLIHWIDNVENIKIKQIEKKHSNYYKDTTFVLDVEVIIDSIFGFDLIPIFNQVEWDLKQNFGSGISFILNEINVININQNKDL